MGRCASIGRHRLNLYLFFSQYSINADAQGVSVAPLAWADRDARPRHRVAERRVDPFDSRGYGCRR
jgi:hypothetical protein